MNLYRTIVMVVIGCAAAGLLVAAAPADRPADVTYVAGPDSGRATVTGTSTLHDWKMTSKVIGGWVVVSSGQPKTELTTVDLSIEARSLKSTEGSGMDKNAYSALKSDKYPVIHYRLRQAQTDDPGQTSGGARRIDATGELTIAGVRRDIALQLLMEPQPNGQLLISTQTQLKMSDFGIKPPTAMLGMIKAGDQVTVDVQWRLTPKPEEGGDR